MEQSKSRTQRIIDLQEPFVRDFDPEEDGPADSGDDNEPCESDNEIAATEHYAVVGKSKLRTGQEIPLGPQYAGARISREALFNDESRDNDDQDEVDEEEEPTDSDCDSDAGAKFGDPDDMDIDVDDDDQDIDSDIAFGQSDEERFKGFAFRGSSKAAAVNGSRKRRPTAADFMSSKDDEDAETDEDILSVDDQHSDKDEADSDNEGSGEEEDDDDGEGEENNEDKEEADAAEATRRAELRKIMNEEQETVVATISQAAKADANKGIAVRQQRKEFDSLLGVRMVLQKGLIATNSIVAVEDKHGDDATDEPYQAAEDAAIKLWSTLDGLRHQLIKATSDAKVGQKRKRDVDNSTPSSTLWEIMQASEVASIDMRQKTLEKWWSKVKSSTAPLTGKLNNNATAVTLTSVIHDQLAKSDALDKTKKPRSCAPVQDKLKLLEDPNIYDDTTLYKTLLNQLVEQRKSDSAPPVQGVPVESPAKWVVKEAKMRKVVDTKASKGRKLRYTVHEKLQNFMAPEDRGTWEQEAVDRFFGSLLGQKITLGEEATIEDDLTLGEQGLRLF